jgi:phage terminase small subunit
MPAKLQAGELTLKQTRFVEHYVSNGGNATLAYVEAGYKDGNAGSNAGRLIGNEIIQLRIAEERERAQRAINFSRDDALKILVGIATASIEDFAPVASEPDNVESYKDLRYKRHALKSIEKNDYGVKITLSDKLAALNELAKILGFNKPSNQDDGTVDDGGILEALSGILSSGKKT